MSSVIIPYVPRAQQKEIHREIEKHRFSVAVIHRRFGKTVMAVNHLIKQAVLCRQRQPRYAYLAPFLKQAKLIAWDFLKYYTSPIPQTRINESELFVELPNGSRIYLWGSDNPDALRGTYLDGVVMDEYAQFKPGVYEEIIRPALSDRNGWALWIGTPKGQNAFYEIYNRAVREMDAGINDWYACLFRADETKVLPEDELNELRRSLPESVYRQEFLCDWTAAADNILIGIDTVIEATKRTVLPQAIDGAPKIMGVDCARFGDDRSCMAVRQGILLKPPVVLRQMDLMTLVGEITRTFDNEKPDALFVDEGGLGAGVVDRLRQLKYPVIGVNFGAKAIQDGRYANKRAEMWDMMREWLVSGGVIPNMPELKSDLIGPTYSFDPSNRMKLESKDDMKKRGISSPDVADALCLTWAYPVQLRKFVPTVSYPATYDPLKRRTSVLQRRT